MKWRAKITFGMLIVSVLFSTTVLGRNLWMQEKEQMKFEVLRDRISAEKQKNGSAIEAKRTGDKTRKSLSGGERTVLPEYQEIAKENPDFTGWVSIEGTRIDYPVMQTPCEPEYYIHRNLAGEYSYAGVPFVGRGDLKAENGDVFIYGHNMRNGTMFADLLKYKEKQYLQDHPVIRLDTLWEWREYEIFAVLDVSEEEWSQEGGMFNCYGTNFILNRKEYLKKLEKRSLCKNDITVEINDRLLFMVTCSYQKENGRIVIVARKRWKTK